MKAYILPDGIIRLGTRTILPTHAGYASLAAMIHERIGIATKTPASCGSIEKPLYVSEPEFRLSSGYGGHPWMGGVPDYGETYDIPLEHLHVDPDRFQFKHGSHEDTGVTTDLDPDAFDADTCDELGVWKDPDDGKTYVVDGHHRRELGERDGVESMRCKYIKADTAEEARKIGGEMNGVRLSAADASGHLHKDKGPGGGQFTGQGKPGGAKQGKPAKPLDTAKPVSRSAALNAKHADLRKALAGMKQERIDTFNAIKADAESEMKKVGKSFSAISKSSDNIASMEGDLQNAYIELDSLKTDFDDDWNPSQKFTAFKEIEQAAKATLAANEVEPLQNEFSDEDKKSNKAGLTKIISFAIAARQHLKAYVGHRKEMQAIKSGEDVKLSMDDDLTIDPYDDLNGVRLSAANPAENQPTNPAPTQPSDDDEPEPEFPDADRSPDLSPEDEEILRRIWNEPKQSVSLSATHAPSGYTHQKPLAIQGKNYVGGEFVPGDVVARATPEEKARLGIKQDETKVGDQKNPKEQSPNVPVKKKPKRPPVTKYFKFGVILDADRKMIGGAKPAIDKVFGKDVTEQDIRYLIGVSDGSVYATTSLNDNGRDRDVLIIANSDRIKDMRRTISKNADGDLEIHNDLFFMHKDSQGGGYGTQVFADEVRSAANMGVKKIVTVGGRGRWMNGYTTWPKLGYDAKLPNYMPAMPKNIKEAKPKTIQDLLTIPGGSEYWKKHGQQMEMTFDLTPGSKSLSILNKYLVAKGKPPIEVDAEEANQTRAEFMDRRTAEIQANREASEKSATVSLSSVSAEVQEEAIRSLRARFPLSDYTDEAVKLSAHYVNNC